MNGMLGGGNGPLGSGLGDMQMSSAAHQADTSLMGVCCSGCVRQWSLRCHRDKKPLSVAGALCRHCSYRHYPAPDIV